MNRLLPIAVKVEVAPVHSPFRPRHTLPLDPPHTDWNQDQGQTRYAHHGHGSGSGREVLLYPRIEHSCRKQHLLKCWVDVETNALYEQQIHGLEGKSPLCQDDADPTLWSFCRRIQLPAYDLDTCSNQGTEFRYCGHAVFEWIEGCLYPKFWRSDLLKLRQDG